MSTWSPRTSPTRILLVLALGLFIAGCLDRAVTGPASTSGASFAARLVVLDGNAQSGAVNSPLSPSLKLRVTDANGSPVEGATVTFSTRQGGGSINPPTARSGADGIVNATWTLGTALGTQKIVATLIGQWVVDSAVLTANATNGPAAKLAVDAGDAQRATIGTALPSVVSVLVTDQFNNPAPDQEVTFRVTGGGGRVDLVTTKSDAAGKIAARWTLGTIAGTQTLSASLPNGATADFRATADAGAAVQLIEESGSGQTGTVGRALTSPVSVRVVDAYGNAVRGVSVSWAAEDGTISAVSASTDSLGRSQARWVLGKNTGTQTASVAVSGAPALNVIAIAKAGAPALVTVETGDRQTQTVLQTLPLPLVARITDQFGNGVSGTGATWAVVSGGGTLLSTSPTTDATGRSTAVWTLGTSAGSQLTTLSVSGLPLAVYTATGVAASGDSVVIEAGNNQTGVVSAALPTPLIVRVRDTSGNPVVGTTVVFAITSGGGTLTPSIATTDANGRAQAAWTLGSFAGAQTVTATVGSKVLTFVATASAVGGGGGGGGGVLTPSQIVLVSGNGQSGFVSQTLASAVVVRVIDASGIPVSGVNVTWALAASNNGGLASPSVSRTDGNGDASLLWTLGSKVGLQQVTASVTGLPNVTLQATAQVGSSGAVVVDNGNGQTGAIGAPLPVYLRVLIVDQSGTPVSSARVNWSVVSGGGTLSKSSGTTNNAGLDSLAWTLGTAAGNQSASASVTGVGSVTFTATAGGSIVVDNGNNQSGNVNTTLGTYLRVKVVGPTGAAISGVTVNWSVTAGGGVLSKSQGVTNVAGQDSVQLTLGASAGTNAVQASVTGVGSVSFSATGSTVAAVPASIVKISGDGQTARSGQTLTSGLIVEVRDAAGSPLASVPVTFATYNGGFVAPTPVLTGADGRVTASWTLSTNTGTSVVTDSVLVSAGAAPPAKFYASVRPAFRIQWIKGGLSASNPTQTDTTGATLTDTLTVQVYDPTGGAVLGVGGQLVSWAPYATSCVDGYSVNSVTNTDNNGYAKTLWVLRTPNTCTPSGVGIPVSNIQPRMIATATGVGQVEFRATVNYGSVHGITATGFSGDTASITSVSTRTGVVTITVKDANGNGVPGAAVTLTTSGGDVVGSAALTTGSDGTTSTSWTIAATLGQHTLGVLATKAATPYATVFNVTRNYIIIGTP